MRKHSFLSPKCEARNNSKIHRYGVFAKEDIKKGELVVLWGGYTITLDELRKLPREIHDYPVQIYENFYLGPKSKKDLDDCEMFNHSCNANAGVKGQNILVARRKIKAGEEICFDYETTDTQDLKFTCKCGAKNCRGKIDGTSWENLKFQRSSKGYLSFYIQEKIKRLKKREFATKEKLVVRRAHHPERSRRKIVLSAPVPAYLSGRQGKAGLKDEVRGEFLPRTLSEARRVNSS